MYTKEQEAYALAEYERTGSVIETIRRLGYPSKATLYRWYDRKRAGLENQHGRVRQYPIGAGHYSNTPEHPRNAPTKLKYEAIRQIEAGSGLQQSSGVQHRALAAHHCQHSEKWPGQAGKAGKPNCAA